MCQITVRLRCPVDPEDWRSLKGVVVSRWLPLSEDHQFTVNAEGMEFRVWFDEDCLTGLEDVSEMDVDRRVNIALSSIGLDVTIPDVRGDLAEFIYDEADRRRRNEDLPETERYQAFSSQYEELGKRVQRGAVRTLNRIIDYFRVQKGQYRLTRYELDPRNTHSFFLVTQAKVYVKEEWVRWCPPPYIQHAVARIPDEHRLLTEDEWPDLIEFVQGPRSAPAVLDFLSRAEALAAEGYDRSAIVEGVSALETALYDFARYPDRDRLDDVSEHGAAHRIDFDRLHDRISSFGLSGSLAALLPVLLPTHLLPDETLERCQEANELRVNVVHNAQRNIDDEELRDLLKGVRELCEILLDLTDPPTPPAQ